MILDVGCGFHPCGDVNVDISKSTIDIPNFVCADGQYLPFRNRVFTKAVSYHTIEHVGNPILMVEEMKRVADGIVRIVTPFTFSYDLTRLFRKSVARMQHRHWFLTGFFKKLGFKAKVKVVWQRPTICKKLSPFYFPFLEIIATGRNA